MTKAVWRQNVLFWYSDFHKKYDIQNMLSWPYNLDSNGGRERVVQEVNNLKEEGEYKEPVDIGQICWCTK